MAIGDKGYRINRQLPLEKWDISFHMNLEIFKNVLSYIGSINVDVPIKFYKDKFLINLKSSDSISFSRIEFEISEGMEYDSGLGNLGGHEKDEKDDISKLVYFDSTDLGDEIGSYGKGEDLISIRIDTKSMKKIEFTCNEFKTWRPLLAIPDFLAKLDRTIGNIQAAREDKNRNGAFMVLEPEAFQKICNLGGKRKDMDIILEASKNGLTVYTSDKESGSSITIENVEQTIDDSSYDIYSDMNTVESDDSDDSYSDMGNVNDIADEKVDEIDEKVEETDDNSESEEEEEVDMWDTYLPKRNVRKKDQRKTGNKNEEKKIEKKEKEKEKEIKKEEDDKKKNTGKVLSKFWRYEILGGEKHSVHMKKDFICTLLRLKDQSTIAMEIRDNRPIVLEQKNSGMWRTMLTVAPIIEDEDM